MILSLRQNLVLIGEFFGLFVAILLVCNWYSWIIGKKFFGQG